MENVISVSKLNEYIRDYLDANIMLSGLAVCGEITGFKRHSSGHMYFSIKDSESVLQCSFFRGDNYKLDFTPQDGMQVVLLGRPTIYSKQGKYHFVVRQMHLQGSGDAAAKLEELKKKLLSEGLFDIEKKKKLPILPKSIGVVTSQTGAVFHDILNVTHKRAPNVNILLSPVAVQGSDAPQDIVRGLKEIQKYNVDVIIIGRGGGSAEELGCFNDEQVVRAVADCSVPIISAVGHEVDLTLCDLAADVRAATPSQAAEFAVADVGVLKNDINQKYIYINKMLDDLIKRREEILCAVENHYLIRQPEIMLENAYQDLDESSDKINNVVLDVFKACENQIANVCGKLDGMSPLKVLARGYSVVSGEDNKSINHVEQLSKGQNINIRFAKGEARAIISEVYNG